MDILGSVKRFVEWFKRFVAHDPWQTPEDPRPLKASELIVGQAYLHVVVIGGAVLHMNELRLVEGMKKSEDPLTPDLIGFQFFDLLTGRSRFCYADGMGLVPEHRENLERVFHRNAHATSMLRKMVQGYDVRGYLKLIAPSLTPHEYMLLSPARDRALFVNDDRDRMTHRKEQDDKPRIVRPIEEAELVSGTHYITVSIREDGKLFQEEFILIGRSTRVADEYDIFLLGHSASRIRAKMSSWALGFDRSRSYGGLTRVFVASDEARNIIGNIVRFNDKEGMLEIIEKSLTEDERALYHPDSARAQWDRYLDDEDRRRGM